VSKIRIANAPCSWGSLEFEGLDGQAIPYPQMLDELKETGYEGTELGDWGSYTLSWPVEEWLCLVRLFL